MNFLYLLMLISSLSLLGCSSNESENIEYIKASNVKKETIKVYGMTCVGCEVTLEKSILKSKGIVSVKASHTSEHVLVEYDKSQTDKASIEKSIQNSGYKLHK